MISTDEHLFQPNGFCGARTSDSDVAVRPAKGAISQLPLASKLQQKRTETPSYARSTRASDPARRSDSMSKSAPVKHPIARKLSDDARM